MEDSIEKRGDILKLLTIELCNHCRYCDNNMYGTRCFHPKVIKPHPDGVVPKTIKRKGILAEIPKWCPLEDYKTD